MGEISRFLQTLISEIGCLVLIWGILSSLSWILTYFGAFWWKMPIETWAWVYTHHGRPQKKNRKPPRHRHRRGQKNNLTVDVEHKKVMLFCILDSNLSHPKCCGKTWLTSDGKRANLKIFFQIAENICPNCQINLFKLQNVSIRVGKRVCL